MLYDYVVIGAGVSGLAFANQIRAEHPLGSEYADLPAIFQRASPEYFGSRSAGADRKATL